jgi:hypothetical protein
MADETKKAWQEVADNFSTLGRHVSAKYRATAGTESEAEEAERQKLGKAVRSAIDQLNDVFTSLGDALREPEGKAALSQSVRSVGKALTTTFQEVGDEIGKTFSPKDRAPKDAPTTGEPPARPDDQKASGP